MMGRGFPFRFLFFKLDDCRQREGEEEGEDHESGEREAIVSERRQITFLPLLLAPGASACGPRSLQSCCIIVPPSVIMNSLCWAKEERIREGE